jgi:hypothetical protein
MIEESVTIENHLFDAFFLGALTNQLADENGLGDFTLRLIHRFKRFFHAGGACQRNALFIIYDLRVNMPGASEYTQPGTFCRTGHRFPDTPLPF